MRQLCGSCKRRNGNCYCAPNSCCEQYEPNEPINTGVEQKQMIDHAQRASELEIEYKELNKECQYLREENQKLTEKLERFECDKVYEDENNDKLRAEARHWEMMFTNAERNRQILAAQMDVVYLIFGKKN